MGRRSLSLLDPFACALARKRWCSEAALVGLLDLAWTREQLFDLLIKSKSQLSWVVGASKACLVLDVNARLLEVLGLLSPVPDPGLFGWCWRLACTSENPKP